MNFRHLFDCDTIETVEAECFNGSEHYRSLNLKKLKYRNMTYTFCVIFSLRASLVLTGALGINCTNFAMHNSLCLVRTSTDINQDWPNSRINLDNHSMHLAYNMKRTPFL